MCWLENADISHHAGNNNFLWLPSGCLCRFHYSPLLQLKKCNGLQLNVFFILYTHTFVTDLLHLSEVPLTIIGHQITSYITISLPSFPGAHFTHPSSAAVACELSMATRAWFVQYGNWFANYVQWLDLISQQYSSPLSNWTISVVNPIASN